LVKDLNALGTRLSFIYSTYT